jgi:hypothetical protein
MPILDIQRGLREVGRIRCGDQVETANGRRAPRKLERFRFTSDDQALIAQVAQLYGGEVAKWEGAPLGDQWQVYVAADRVPVVIAPGLATLSQWHELWSGGGCQRRCDGEVEQLTHVACICVAEGERQCKPTTRLSVILPEVPGLGVWRLESHGYYAARELGGQLALVDQVVQRGGVVVATLRLTFREDRRPGQPIKRYTVPALDVSGTFAQLAAAAGAPAPAIDGTADVAQLYRPNDASVATDAARAALPSPETVAQAEANRGQAQAAKRASKRAKPDLPSGRTRGTAGVTTTVPEPAPPEGEQPMTEAMHAALEVAFREAGLADRDDIKAFCEAYAKRPLAHANSMSATDGAAVLDALAAVAAGTHTFTLNDEVRPVGIEPDTHRPAPTEPPDPPEQELPL